MDIVDLIVSYATDKIGAPNTAKVVDDRLMLFGTNHLGAPFSMHVPVHFDGEPRHSPPRWVLKKLGPTVWKLWPSVVERGVVHAFVTIVDVPNPAPWETT